MDRLYFFKILRLCFYNKKIFYNQSWRLSNKTLFNPTRRICFLTLTCCGNFFMANRSLPSTAIQIMPCSDNSDIPLEKVLLDKPTVIAK